MKVKSESEVAQSCLTLSDPMDCSPPGSSIHGIFQARVLEWGAIAFSRKDLPYMESKHTKSTAIFKNARPMLFEIIWKTMHYMGCIRSSSF